MTLGKCAFLGGLLKIVNTRTLKFIKRDKYHGSEVSRSDTIRKSRQYMSSKDNPNYYHENDNHDLG